MTAQQRPAGYRLADEISPYLRSQADDLVAWYPWGDEALQAARRDNKPIFLSVGYSTCRWCHIMARESFRDTTVARWLNEHFINIKVDREERPDIDEIFMAATQIYHHGGGWPNSVFLTPDLKPYFCGTFFPLEDMGAEQPGFRTVVESMAHAWQHRRPDVEEQGNELATVMQRFLSDRGPLGDVPSGDMVQRAFTSLKERFDDTWGGFGEGAKFPMPANLLLLLELADQRPQADDMLRRTLEAMAAGGVHDVLGGGFHRFATDRQWRRPHFEKLLADNAWLLYIYACQALRGDDAARRVTRRLADFICRELATPDGPLSSALDGDTEGREGEYYLWSLGQLAEVLGDEQASFLAPLLGYDGPPQMGELHILHWATDLAAQAARRRCTVEALLQEVQPLLDALATARARRPRPVVDDKILCDANGIAVAALAKASQALEDPELLRRGGRIGRWLWRHMRGDDGRLRHAHHGSTTRHGAFLSDYAGLLWGLLHLAPLDTAEPWLEWAESLAAELVEALADPSGAGFWNAPADDSMPYRNKEIFDGAYPSSNALALLALLELDRRLQEVRGSGPSLYREVVAGSLRAFQQPARDQVESLRAMAVVVHRFHRSA